MKKQLLFVYCLMLCSTSCQKQSENIFLNSFSPTTDGPGITVTIRGKNFGNDLAGTKVSFNGVGASVVSVNDSTIVVTVPVGATTGPLQISANGRTMTSQSNFTVLTGLWTRKADFPGDPRASAIGFAIAGKGYIATGYNGGSGTNDLYEYDPVSNKWTAKTSLPVNVDKWPYESSVFVINNKAYLLCGRSAVVLGIQDIWEYDPVSDKWTARSPFPGRTRYSGAALSIGNMGYFGLGDTDTISVSSKEWWQYDPSTDLWTQLHDFPGVTSDLANSFSLPTIGYVGTPNSYSDATNPWWRYDPISDGWTKASSKPGFCMASSTGFTVNGYCYVVNGIADSSCWVYDVQNDIWQQKTSWPKYHIAAIGFSIGNKGYLGTGGSDGGWLTKDFWEFDPQK